MARQSVRGFAAAVMVAALCAGALAAQDTDGDGTTRLGPEMSFENGGMGFTCEVSKETNALCFIQDPTSARDGSKGVGITIKSPAPKNEDDVVLKSGDFDLEAGSNYTFTFWGFAAKPPAKVIAVVEDEDGEEVERQELSLIADWQQQAIVVKPEDDGLYRLLIKGIGKNASMPVGTSSKYSFDVFALHEGEVEPEQYELPKQEDKPTSDAILPLPPAPKLDEDGDVIVPSVVLPDLSSNSTKSTKGALVLESGEEGKNGGDDDNNDGDDKGRR